MERASSSFPRSKCPQCGEELPANLALCPKCLLQQGLDSPTGPGPGSTLVMPAEPSRSSGLPQPAEKLGHYQIIRSLGGGGMGAVFEAQDLENGRRVALKVLSQTLDSPEARQRFFREGRLAASINHPNSVYVFGTEEIGGTPVITMELVAGGTLEERVRRGGLMPPAEAVDAVLQIIAGLEAAQHIGILHRDIKPSNCFRDADGTIKIGDFGLSISTAVRTEPTLTATGSFLGTPAFCSPEQLRGEELNVRSDIYSVGATLFYLLTGRTPFEAKSVVPLIAAILEQPAPSPRRVRPELPQGLAKAVRRCLERTPGERFKSYDELRQALAPFSSTLPTPAPLGQRFAAGAVDFVLLSLCAMLLVMPGFKRPLNFPELLAHGSWRAAAVTFGGLVASILYYALLEGRWGATVGKSLCRLRVVGPDRNVPRLRWAFLRAFLYVTLPALPALVFFGGASRAVYFSSSSVVQYLTQISYYALLALLFCTARRRNGLAAVHDLITRTRVVSLAALEARPVFAATDTPPPQVEAKRRIGPYHVLETLEETGAQQWLLGYDLRLLRKVWLRATNPDTPPVPQSLRNIGRAGRLRWLTGKRSPEESWDAFEAPAGRPLVRLIKESPQPWKLVRFWLLDLAVEIGAAVKDDTLPRVLALNRVWITNEGRAKLLDFPAPGLGSDKSGNPNLKSRANLEEETSKNPENQSNIETTSAVRFLGQVACAALEGRVEAAGTPSDRVAVPLPLHARQFLQGMSPDVSLDTLLAALRPLLQRVTEVSRWRRAAVVAGCLAFPVVAASFMVLGLALLQNWSRQNPGVLELNQILSVRSSLHFWAKPEKGPTDRQFGIYIAAHHREIITNAASWSSPLALALVKGASRRFAEAAVRDYPTPTEAEIADADSALKKYLPDIDPLVSLRHPTFLLMAGPAILVIYVCLPALLAAAAFRGGLVLLIAGVTFVRRDGQQASRARAFWRALVAWCPLCPAMVCFVIGAQQKALGIAILAGGLWLALAILSLALPVRGLQDRLAGTWPVPR